MNKFDFKDLFVLDLANNHQGSVFHGRAIIKYCSELCIKYKVRGAIKFQYRDLPNFIHVDHQHGSNNKHVPRFLSTMLTWEEFEELKNYAGELGLLTICTPFDEVSVSKIVEHGFDVVKVASCSATDWPLLESVAKANLPVIASTGGLSLLSVDNLVSFLSHQAVDFALMHCVSIYPTPDENCNLLDIQEFKERYPGTIIGWSTHESPVDTVHVGLAAALGAQMFERHVGLETDDISLNAYSSNPLNLENWLIAYNRAITILGSKGRTDISPLESDAIAGLRRGVYAKTEINEGEVLTSKNTYFAFPLSEGGLACSDFKPGMISSDNLDVNSAVKNVVFKEDRRDKAAAILKAAIHDVKAMLAKAKIMLGHDFKTEYSHHYGIENFREVGTVLIEVVNRDYAKKLLVQLPGQRHPLHMHKLKEETFVVLSGDLNLKMDKKEFSLTAGDKVTVLPGIWHEFKSFNGCILEEISTTAISGDSVYKEQEIDCLSSAERKTIVDHWGRFQIQEQLLSR